MTAGNRVLALAAAVCASLCAAAPAHAAAPVLFFSDLDWGPKSGFEGSASRGAAVSVWGKNLGATRGTSTVIVNGAAITDYAEWGVTADARGLERVTFWLNSECNDGAGSITVTVGGVTSNPLPFLVTTGAIYFVSVTDGSNDYNGSYATRAGHSGDDGPFCDLCMFNPGLDSYTSCHNPSGDGQYIVYVRGGTYTDQDQESAMIALRGPYGGPDQRKALLAYPGETPHVDTSAAERGLIWNAFYSPYGFNDYITVAKLFATGGTAPVSIEGDYGRVIGCTFKDYLDSAWTGVVWVSAAKHAAIYGNLFDHNGYDSYKHNIYIKTQRADIALPPGRDLSTQEIDVGWNEFRDATSGTDRRGGVIFVSKEGHDDVAALPTHNIYIHDNRFTGGDMDFIYIGDSTTIGDVYVFNNTFNGGTSTNGGMTFYDGCSEVFLYNNTFYRIGPADEAMAWATGAAHLHFVNNIWYPSPGQEVFHLETYQGATFASSHDLYFAAAGATLPASGDGTTVTNSVSGEPAFADAESGDFHLLATGPNPALDAGTASVGAMVAVDADGNARPQGAAFDIGAFEYVPRCASDSDCDSPPECRSAENPTCNDSGACEYRAQPDGDPCGSDGNACTDDVCDAGTCTHAGHAGLSCSDGDACTTPDTCNSAAECVPGPDTCGGCTDLDSDGYGDPASASCAHAELDCNDGEALVHPGAIELCNFVDDNCDGSTDEPFALGSACTVGVGACTARGVLVCNDAENGTLCDAVADAPTAEVCGNDVDEDCNGVLDNGCTCEAGSSRPCYGGPAGTEGVGVCQAGTQRCPNGTWGDCVGQVRPGFEVCGDGLDNDCNGLADADDLATCGTGCADADEDDHADLACGGDDCNDGDAGVHPGAAEVCGDGADNNCDGLTDREDVATCGSEGDVVGIGCQCSGGTHGGLAHGAWLALLSFVCGLGRRR